MVLFFIYQLPNAFWLFSPIAKATYFRNVAIWNHNGEYPNHWVAEFKRGQQFRLKKEALKVVLGQDLSDDRQWKVIHLESSWQFWDRLCPKMPKFSLVCWDELLLDGHFLTEIKSVQDKKVGNYLETISP